MYTDEHYIVSDPIYVQEYLQCPNRIFMGNYRFESIKETGIFIEAIRGEFDKLQRLLFQGLLPTPTSPVRRVVFLVIAISKDECLFCISSRATQMHLCHNPSRRRSVIIILLRRKVRCEKCL